MTPPGGCRPVPHNVFAIEDQELLLPDPIVTLDTGFALLPSTELTIYTDRSRLASCRKKRPQ